MQKVLITGGTVFVSRYMADYFVRRGDEVYALNRNTHTQVSGVKLIESDRNCIGDKLKGFDFDLVLAVNTYSRRDIADLIGALDTVNDFVFISSSAVYPETLAQPFSEEQPAGKNSIWGDYGINKYEAEKYLLEKVPNAYILRPPYLYGPMQNLYREGFVFDCAMQSRVFCIPGDGSMPLQFFHVNDLCCFIDILQTEKPENHIFNVGNREIVSVEQWVDLCYAAVGKKAEKIYVNVDKSHPQRSFFCFYDYGYSLDVSKQHRLMPYTKPLSEGLRESYEWYAENSGKVNKKPYFEYIDRNILR